MDSGGYRESDYARRAGMQGGGMSGQHGFPGYGGSGWGSSSSMGQGTTSRRGPKGWQRTDDRLKDDICERLYHTLHIDSSEVTVEVKDGKVMLDGTVPQRGMKHALEDLIDSLPGVHDIDNRVRVSRHEGGSQSQSGQSQGGQSLSGQSTTGTGSTSGSTSGMSGSSGSSGGSGSTSGSSGSWGSGASDTGSGSSSSSSRSKKE
jgi:hypothetical protein